MRTLRRVKRKFITPRVIYHTEYAITRAELPVISTQKYFPTAYLAPPTTILCLNVVTVTARLDRFHISRLCHDCAGESLCSGEVTLPARKGTNSLPTNWFTRHEQHEWHEWVLWLLLLGRNPTKSSLSARCLYNEKPAYNIFVTRVLLMEISHAPVRHHSCSNHPSAASFNVGSLRCLWIFPSLFRSIN